MAEPGQPGPVRVERLGEAALLVVLEDRVDEAVNVRVLDLATALGSRRAATPGLGSPVPACGNLLVPFDPLIVDEATVRGVVAAALEDPAAHEAAVDEDVITIPVRYGGADGPDLASVAAGARLTEDDVVRLHAGTEYRVFCVGFVPGFPYLGMLPEELAMPRRPTPRLRVPAGSVAIAGRQTGIYPAATPGGWHLVGWTDVAIWDPRRDPPALLRPGTRVRFRPV